MVSVAAATTIDDEVSSSTAAAVVVAAALRDRVVQELAAENKRLECQLKDQSLLTITGRGGTPVYCQAHVVKAGRLYVSEMGPHSDWFVRMRPLQQRLPWSVVETGLELRLGGIVLRKSALLDQDGSSCNGDRFSVGFVEEGPVRKLEGVLTAPPPPRLHEEDRFGTVRSGRSKLERLARSQDVVIEGVLIDQTAIRELISNR